MTITSSLFIFIFIFVFVFLQTNAQNASDNAHRTTSDAISNFQPSLALIISMLVVMFSLTLFLLLYAKFCHRPASTTPTATLPLSLPAIGLDKSLIESLPFFRFSSLLGSRAGLECAVCLAKFDDADVLRLLPKCKHAFHIDCIDQWLEKNFTCPLCRRHVTADDLSASLRFLHNPPPVQDSNLELYIEREESRHGSSRFCIDEEEEEEEAPMPESMLHRFNHKIVVLKSRWSNVSSSDIMLLNSAEEEERKLGFESGSRNPDDKRSMSEIVVHPRFHDLRNEEINVREERRRRVWLPIARKTVQWFASRERRSSPQSQEFR
ncbi:RING-type E3 ubiquitin transferase [Salvia divinorum]|uniref:RING-type E3 ubiquitin transferase n=1 Tax=Salvia divinorum TaxID=28513 RepID=A0ABD1GU40_SALDI